MPSMVVRSGQWLLIVALLSSCGPLESPTETGDRRGYVDNIMQSLTFPSLSGVSPARGSPRGGYTLTVSGANFLGASCDLDFGGTHVTVKPITSSKIELKAPSLPAGSRPHRVVIQVACSGLPSRSSVEFWYIEDPSPLLPPLTARGAAGQRDLGVADLDGDGNNDIVIANPSEAGLKLYRGLGHGKFAEVRDLAVTSALAVPNGSYSVSLGDLDKDGRIDIVVTQLRASNLTIFWNETKTAGAWDFTVDTRSIAATASTAPKAITIADLDADGWDDLIVAHPADNSLSFLAVTAGRTVASWFAIKAPLPAPVSWAVESLVAADLNRDGAKELVALSNGGKLLTIIPDVTRFTVPWQWKSLAAEYGTLAISDLDKDGRQEIVLGASTDAHILVISADLEGSIGSVVPRRFATSGPVQSIDIADVNGDALPDVVAGLRAIADQSVNILAAEPASLLKPAQALELGSRGGYVRVIDMDSDGLPDAVLLDVAIPVLSEGQNLLTVRRNTGTSFEPMWLMNTGGPQPSLLAHLDTDGDGYVDFAIADTSARTLRAMLGNGLGSFRPAGAPILLPGMPGCLAAGNCNGDRYEDVLVCRSEPTNHGIDLWTAVPGGAFKRERSMATTAVPQALARDEFGIGLDGNAFPDFVAGGSGAASTLVTLVGQPPAMVDFTRRPYTIGKALTSLIMANFGDLNNDVLAAATLDDAVFLLSGDGAGGLGGPRKVASVTEPDFLAVADFDQNGLQDFVTLSSSQGKLSVFVNDGTGTFSSPRDSEVDFGATSAPTAVVVGDFNQDKVPDLAVRLDGSLRIRLLLGLGDGRFIAAPAEILPDSSGALDVVDVDGDGLQDLVFSVGQAVSGHPTGWLITLLTGSR